MRLGRLSWSPPQVADADDEFVVSCSLEFTGAMSDLMAHTERLPHSTGGSISTRVSALTTAGFASEYGVEARLPELDPAVLPSKPSSNAETAGDARQHQFPLVFCPEFPSGTVYRLVRLDDRGANTLYEGVALSDAPSLNLAKVRHRGARLGANRVILVPPSPSIRLVSLEP